MTLTRCEAGELVHVDLGLRPTRAGVGAHAAPLRALGLLVPDSVDPASGYRSYSPEQLHLLNPLVALKDLGFTLDQVRSLLVEPVGADELRGMLRLRRAELEEEARAVGTRLAAVESRLGMIEKENTVSPDDVVKTSPHTSARWPASASRGRRWLGGSPRTATASTARAASSTSAPSPRTKRDRVTELQQPVAR